MLALITSYFKEYFIEGSAEKKQMEYTECRYIIIITAEVREVIIRRDVSASTVVITALLFYEAILNLSLYLYYWTKYFYLMLDPAKADVEANLAIISTVILIRTFLLLNGKRAF